ncbi:uncharacterized protein LOC114298900 isoform X2 [Camellia sinensis]|uniref:uncharacterized protein LOC114298900 isoform X2 n=1 Tax=Camellia sinensis TaxID=4442 RepID=UPI0010368123|nr:uncharacterized protein LOC114298900 isoform X2 [Camellia sinensis]
MAGLVVLHWGLGHSLKMDRLGLVGRHWSGMNIAGTETPQELQNENVPPHLIPRKTFGNRPSFSLLLLSLNAYNNGQEWCEKQMEFSLLFGKPEKTKAMKAGIARHAVLEEEMDELIH